ncbi:MAG: Zn-dependent oligopeptidase [Bacteroidales bacterium]|nr:Zn-dependent oligopeptidase [Bacteroidales bacterium]MDT8432216.1 M3 family metallopeptidase [Bacteroidales bacterium]
MAACNQDPATRKDSNPFFTGLNEPVQYADVTGAHISEYAQITMEEAEATLEGIRTTSSPEFNNVFVPYDKVVHALTKASNNCFMLYWVSPDSLSRAKGLEAYLQIDSMMTSLTSDGRIYSQMLAFSDSDACAELTGHRKRLVDDVMQYFEHAGVNLATERLATFKKLKAGINDLSSQYSINMNTADEKLVLDEAGAAGLPENFKERYKQENGTYEIPVMPATRQPVMNNADAEATRKAFLVKYQNRGYKKNLEILDALVSKRDQLADLMDYATFAGYTTSMKMSKNPEAVWTFLEDLIARAREKAVLDHERLKQKRNSLSGIQSDAPVNPWDVSYLRNQILLSEYNVDPEVVREYLPMDACLDGMMNIFSELLGVTYRQVEQPAAWHEDVLLYEVYTEGEITGRFYLDLYPRPSKESWFYGVGINPGRMMTEGYEVPVCMLLGNFTAPTESRPSLISHSELNTLFHEFGHIMDNMSYTGEFASQSHSKEDFGEAMSQLFENWLWDYDMLSSFAKHYETGEVLPRELFDNMLEAKNVTSGLDALGSLRNSVYDMTLYDKYDPENPVDTDALWREIDKEMPLPMYVEGTHPQGSWIHINTHPTYYYGYLWAEVYAQDMFTVFRLNGLTDTETGVRYRELILANGTQWDIEEAVEEFLGRPSNNEAYIKSLGLE